MIGANFGNATASVNQNLNALRENANWERRVKVGRRVALLVSLENYMTLIEFERHRPSCATEPSKRGGRQERRTGLLMEVGGKSDGQAC
jgi:hypothetical protein